MLGCITPKIIHSSLKFLTILFPNLNVKKGKSFTLKEDFKSFVGVCFNVIMLLNLTTSPPPPKAPIMGPCIALLVSPKPSTRQCACLSFHNSIYIATTKSKAWNKTFLEWNISFVNHFHIFFHVLNIWKCNESPK